MTVYRGFRVKLVHAERNRFFCRVYDPWKVWAVSTLTTNVTSYPMIADTDARKLIDELLEVEAEQACHDWQTDPNP